MLCLFKETKDRFVKALKSGELNLDELSGLGSSEERRALLSKFVGEENSKQVNALFESKLLMKNQESAMISFIKQTAGLKPKVQRDLISKVNKLGKVLTPEERNNFFQDLASQRLGTEINAEQAQKISELSRAFNDAKANPNSGLEYGASEVALNNYVNDIRLKNEEVSLREGLDIFKRNPVVGAKDAIQKIAGISKGIKASLDNSAIFRQGWKTLFTNPSIWAKNAVTSFSDIAKQLGKSASNQDVMNGIKAEILSRPNSRNGLFKNMKLEIGNLEEAFPTTIPEKIPLFGRLYKASETAYTGFLYRMRADIADKLVQTATESGVDLTNKVQAESLGKLINSLTGRGSLGSMEKVGKEINTVFFSPKMLKANLDFLTAHQLQKDVTPFVRKQAAINLVKVIGGVATIMGIANTIKPGSAELDPRSADFGKIRIGDTRFDISGGMGSIVTLASRILPPFVGQKAYTKSSSTGKLTQLNSNKYGAKTVMDVFEDFGENKFSPMFSVFKDIANQKDFNGNPTTIPGEAMNLLAPLPITNSIELIQNPNAAPVLAGMIADALGITTNTY
jgi:hypothetical protein